MKIAFFITWDSGLQISIDNGAGRTIGKSKHNPQLGKQAYRLPDDHKAREVILTALFARPDKMFPPRPLVMLEHDEDFHAGGKKLVPLNASQDIRPCSSLEAAFIAGRNPDPAGLEKSQASALAAVMAKPKPAAKPLKGNAKDIAALINETGPLSVAQLMAMCDLSRKPVMAALKDSAGRLRIDDTDLVSSHP